MSRTIRLLRHAAAQPAYTAGSDAQRTLARDGEIQVRTLLAEVQAVWNVSHCLSSDAMRARQTVEPLASSMGFPVDYRAEIYSGGSAAVLDLVAELDDSHLEILVVGHNPTMSSVASLLAGKPVSLGTAGHRTVELDVASWSDLAGWLG